MGDQVQKVKGDNTQAGPEERSERVRPISEGFFVTYNPTKRMNLDDFNYLMKHLRHRFKKNEISLLCHELDAYHIPETDIARFFEKKSYDIFHWILTESSNNASFQFILAKFSREALRYKLRDDNFSFLIEHLENRDAVEKCGLLTQQYRELERARFKFLLEIDYDGIKDFMKKNKKARFMKPSTWEDYEIALQSFNATTTPYIIHPTP